MSDFAFSETVSTTTLEVPKERSPRLFYYREFRKKSHKPIVQATVYYKYDETTGYLSWAVSFCAKEDQFVKKVGRALAQERFASAPNEEVLVKSLKDHGVRKHIIRQLGK